MAVAEALTVHQLREVMATFAQLLEQHKAVINALNVYPVPDGDTGTNMTLTVTSVVAELDGVAEADDVAAVCKAISHGSLMGARGNSGVILSQILRGIAEEVRDAGVATIGPDVLARALARASDGAYGAVLKPVEGTILT
ncbi:MAG: DAK2 domain-containing protein, partial [Acidimicrobiales bacterium]|nr:DAK2 domain-containing protein [Acidimicrobiales bacterium]